MSDPSLSDSLSQLSTHWSQLLDAQGDGEAARSAQCVVLQRYCAAIYNYLAAVTGDSHVAADLSQDFALRFVRGDFQSLDAGRGQFRRFLRTVLYRMAMDYHRSRKGSPAQLSNDGASVADAKVADQEFDRRWREELINRAWAELRDVRQSTGLPIFEVLSWRAAHAESPLADGAAALSQQFGLPVSDAAFRQALHRAREKFGELLLAEVSFSLGSDALADIAAELADLGLLEYCRTALSRRSAARVATEGRSANTSRE